jgi:hypothetical protein
MAPAAPLDAIELGKLEIRLVNQGRGIEGVIASLSAELPVGDAAQLVVHDRQEPVEASGTGPLTAQQ